MNDCNMSLQEWMVGPCPDRADSPIELYCQRCHSLWSFPSGWNDAARHALVELCRTANMLIAFAAFKGFGFDFRDAKLTWLHVSQSPGKCVRCQRSIPAEPEPFTCACGSLNLNW